MTRITWIALTDKMSLKGLRLLPKIRTRKNPLPTMVVHGEHVIIDVERATTPDDIIPMIIIGENDDVRVVGTMVVPLILQIQAVQVDHVDPLDPTDIGHHVIVMTKEYVVHLVIDTRQGNELTVRTLEVLHVPVTLIILVKVKRHMKKKSYADIVY
jgi:hypothetical protein